MNLPLYIDKFIYNNFHFSLKIVVTRSLHTLPFMLRMYVHKHCICIYQYLKAKLWLKLMSLYHEYKFAYYISMHDNLTQCLMSQVISILYLLQERAIETCVIPLLQTYITMYTRTYIFMYVNMYTGIHMYELQLYGY